MTSIGPLPVGKPKKQKSQLRDRSLHFDEEAKISLNEWNLRSSSLKSDTAVKLRNYSYNKANKWGATSDTFLQMISSNPHHHNE